MEGIGDILRQAREDKGLSFGQIEEKIKIKKRYLQALEQEDWGCMPGRVYAKAFLRSYARELGLDDQALGDQFELSQKSGGAGKGHEPAEEAQTGARRNSGPERRREVDLHNKPKKNMIFILCVLSVALLFFVQWMYKNNYLADAGPNTPSEPIIQPVPAAPSPPVSAPPPEVPEPAAPLSFTLTLEAREDCWLRVRDQERQLYEGTLAEGENLSFDALTWVEMRMGNAGGLTVALNGLELAPAGDSGQILDKIFYLEDGVLFDGDSDEAIS